MERSKAISRQADIVAALSLECLKGTTRAFDSRIHKVRPHKGQIRVAQRMRSLLNSEVYPSEIASKDHNFPPTGYFASLRVWAHYEFGFWTCTLSLRNNSCWSDLWIRYSLSSYYSDIRM